MAAPTPAGPATPRQKVQPGEVVGAYVIAVFSAAGLVFSIYLTVLKFRSEFTCEPNLQAMCSGGCDLALSDPLSAPFWGLPITAYASSSFSVLLLCALLVLLFPGVVVSLVRLIVLLLAWGGILVSALLGVYSLLELGGLCSLCAVLYFACIGVFLGAWMMSPRGPVEGLRAYFQRDRRAASRHLPWLMLLIQSSVLFATTAFQYTKYQKSAFGAQSRTNGSFLRCRERISREIPPTAIHIDASDTSDAIAVLMVDFSCPHCRKEYEAWRSLHTAHAERMSRALLHLPMDRNCNSWGNEQGTDNRACAAARFAECAGRMGARTDTLVADLFALQSEETGNAPLFRSESLSRVASAQGLIWTEVSACMDSEEIWALVGRHLAFASHLDVHDPPTSIIARTERNLLVVGHAYLLEGGGRNPAYLESLIQNVLGVTARGN